jgi:hypothetical protein
MDETSERILTTIRRLRGALDVPGGLFVEPEIPAKKLANARTSCRVPESERVLALVDCTAMGSAKHAVLFCEGGVYYHNAWMSARHAGPGHVGYAELSRLPVTAAEAHEIGLGPDRSLELSGCRLRPAQVAHLIRVVQAAVEGRPPPALEPETSPAGPAPGGASPPAGPAREPWPRPGSALDRIAGASMVLVGVVSLAIVLTSHGSVVVRFRYGWLGYVACALITAAGAIRLFRTRP